MDTLRPIDVGAMAPSFSLAEMSRSTGANAGRNISLTHLRGKVIILDFWAQWCGPCVTALPRLERIYRKYEHRGLEVLSINMDAVGDRVKAGQVARKTTFPIVADDGLVSVSYRVESLPHMVVIDQTGRIRSVHRGFSSVGELEEQLSKAVLQLLH